MKSVLLVSLLAVIGCQSAPSAPVSAPIERLSIMQGSTDSTSTVINVVLPKNAKYSYTIMFDSTVLKTPPVREKTWRDSEWKVETFTLTNLTPNVDYDLKVADQTGRIVDEREFHTFALNLKSPSIAVVSCLDDKFTDLQKSQWRAVWNQVPDALFLIGDNVYVDTHVSGVTDSEIWRRYVETRRNLEIYKMPRLIPVFATWDDHDFGSGDGDSSFQYKDLTKEIFQTFFPMEESKTLKKGPGVASAVTIGKQTYVFFDDRTFRSKDRVVPGDTHFGKAQEEWFFKLLGKNKGPFWLIDGDQFFGGHHPFESYEGNHPASFKNFLKRLKAAKRTVVFISGDRHLAEIAKIPKNYLGYPTYEFTSSGLHANMYPGALTKAPNPRGVFGQDKEGHFLLIKGAAISPRHLNLEAAYFGEQSKVLYHQSMEIER